MIGGICAMSGCKETPVPIEPQSNFDYDALYHTEITSAYAEVEQVVNDFISNHTSC